MDDAELPMVGWAGANVAGDTTNAGVSTASKFEHKCMLNIHIKLIFISFFSQAYQTWTEEMRLRKRLKLQQLNPSDLIN